ncbi:TIGR02452 family protein [Planctomycetaceae bacterium SH139]
MNQLEFLPCLDSEEMASARKSELLLGGDLAIYHSRIVVHAVTEGFYENEKNARVDWGEQVIEACVAKRTIPPWQPLPSTSREPFDRTRVQVSNETTFAVARRLQQDGHRPLSLNFANGISPGGGFLTGATAQEESLCRLSSLYWTLLSDPMYLYHSYLHMQDSSDWAILSPQVPFFRDDSLVALDQLIRLDWLTCAAPVAGRAEFAKAAELLKKRIHRVLAIATAYGYTTLVLGAWGCGAFGNDPQRTAEDFLEALGEQFAGSFSDVVFAITDWSPDRKFLGPFRDVFRP